MNIDEKIELMLRIYRDRLERINKPPIDYLAGIQVQAKIEVLENLQFYIMAERKETE